MMTKIVYNACFGGFGLSHEGIMRYAELKGWDFHAEPDSGDFKLLSPWNYFLDGKEWYGTFHFDDNRADPALVQVVEELGDKANGSCADLRIEEIPAGTQYRIDEYDGRESVMTVDSYDWKTA